MSHVRHSHPDYEVRRLRIAVREVPASTYMQPLCIHLWDAPKGPNLPSSGVCVVNSRNDSFCTCAYYKGKRIPNPNCPEHKGS
jgi:hypothetical protein